MRGWNKMRQEFCGVCINRTYGEIAQLVERWIEDPSVGGSIPSLPTIKNQFDFFKKLLYNIYVRLKKKKICGCGGMADTRDLKSLEPGSCGFDSHQPHQNMQK